jgi:Fic family protein
VRALQKPPSLSQLFRKNTADPMSLMKLGQREDVRNMLDQAQHSYWSWDECRHRVKGLDGVTQEAFWTLVKLRRQPGFHFGLNAPNGLPFVLNLTGEIQRKLHVADRSLGGLVGTDIEALNESEYKAKYIASSLREEAFASSLIEGAVSTRVDAKQMIDTQRKPRDKNEWMILNNYETISFLNTQQSQPLSIALLLDIQARLTANTLENAAEAGRLRTATDDVKIWDDTSGEVVHVPPPAEELPARMQAMCNFANDTKNEPFIHPVIRAVLLHFWLAYDHPFCDGNGRTARALFYWAMLRSGYWLAEYVSISSVIAQKRNDYYRAYLNAELDENDATYFVAYHLKVLEQSIEALKADLIRKQAEVAAFAPLLSATLNDRQEALLIDAIKEPRSIFTYESHANNYSVTIPTARADILELVDLGLLNWNRKQRPHRFTPHADILKRLQKKNKKPKK